MMDPGVVTQWVQQISNRGPACNVSQDMTQVGSLIFGNEIMSLKYFGGREGPEIVCLVCDHSSMGQVRV